MQNNMQNIGTSYGGFQTGNYSQSQVTNSGQTYETFHSPVENGGLFTRDECRNLARYVCN